MKDINLINAVAKEIARLYDRDDITVEYPGFVSIPENRISDDLDGSRNAWTAGPGTAPGSWTGELMDATGNVAEGDLTFCVYPKSDQAKDIAEAVYYHGICHHYHEDHVCQDCPAKERT